MFNKDIHKQQEFEFVMMEELMPKDHFLRDLDRLVSFDFIYDKLEHLYSKTGRPSVDPVVIIKMLLIGYLYGINSERRLEQEIKVNIAYRWFLGLKLNEAVPDHSTLSQLRRRKFKGTNIFEEIFDEIVHKCIEVGLVKGTTLCTDSTHVRANANNYIREYIEVEEKPSKYIEELDKAAIRSGIVKEKENKDIKNKTIAKSITDPESGMYNRPGKPKGFYYLSHQTCDGESGIITDVYVTAGNVADNVPHTERIIYQIEKFNFKTKEICADAGYYSSEIHTEMYKRGIKTYIPLNKIEDINANKFNLSDFKYIEDEDCFLCPNKAKLKRSSYQLGKGTIRYICSHKICSQCTYKEKCTSGAKKILERIFNFKYTDAQNLNVGTQRYYELMKLRKIWCEGNFSHQKANHNLSKTFKRGNEKVTEHCLLSAYALNLKRLVKYLKGRSNTFKSFIYIQIYSIMAKIRQAYFLTGLSDYFFAYLSTAPN